jgi:D-serine deaminase-like pyridoxal phosphate-dependent protein
MSYFESIKSPTLLINPNIVMSNLDRMYSKANRLGLKLVPHFKTPQSRDIGKWVLTKGITEVTVSSLKMAKYLSGLGFECLHIAFPFNIREIEAFNDLNETQKLSVQLINTQSTWFLAERLTKSTPFFIEIDAGYGRTGVKADESDTIDEILTIALDSRKLEFRGFYIHPGHTYYGNVEEIYSETRTVLSHLKSKYYSAYPEMAIRIGDTPGCSIIDDFGPATEIGPGNFLFYDLMQANIGSCTKEDIAIALSVPIVNIDRNNGTILVHGGGVHLSKDFIPMANGAKCFGEVVFINESGWKIPESRSTVVSVSQEHGIIQASEELLELVEVGDLIGILPVHSCMTADCMKSYWSTNGGWIDHAEGV